MEEDRDKLQELIEIEELAIKIEDLAKKVRKVKKHIKQGTDTIVNQKIVAEKEINKNPLVYVMASFLGGLLVGGLLTRRRKTY